MKQPYYSKTEREIFKYTEYFKLVLAVHRFKKGLEKTKLFKAMYYVLERIEGFLSKILKQ